MAGIDTSMYSNLTPPPAIDPLGQMNKALAYRNMQSESQIHNVQAQQVAQEYNDQLAMRHAQDNSTTVGNDGSVNVDQNKMLTELGSTAPHLVPQAAMAIQQQKLTAQQNQMKQIQDHATVAAQTLSGINDQASYDQGKVVATNMGYDTSHWPQSYDKDWVQTQAKNAAYAAMNPHDAMTTKIAEQEAGNKAQELQLALKKPQQEAYKDLIGHAETSRQIPDVKQAYIDRYTAQKVLDLVGKEDPNKLSTGMVSLMSGETAKLAQGGSPQTDALQAVTPKDREMLVAQAKEYMSSHPQASQQGAFVKVMQDYAKKIQGGAQKVIDSNVGHLGELYKGHITPEDYKSYQDNVVNGNPYKDNNLPPVNMKLPDGRTGTIPAENVDEALKHGASRL